MLCFQGGFFSSNIYWTFNICPITNSLFITFQEGSTTINRVVKRIAQGHTAGSIRPGNWTQAVGLPSLSSQIPQKTHIQNIDHSFWLLKWQTEEAVESLFSVKKWRKPSILMVQSRNWKPVAVKCGRLREETGKRPTRTGCPLLPLRHCCLPRELRLRAGSPGSAPA